jgi:acyl-CoA thioester hydrolase
MSVVCTHRVGYNETDPFGVVFNSRYLEFADAAMMEYFRLHGWDAQAQIHAGLTPVLAHAEVHYLSPGRLDDLLQISVTPTRLGTSSFVLEYLMRTEQDVCRIVITYVNVDLESGASKPVPPVFHPVLTPVE